MSDITAPTLWQRLLYTRLRDAIRGQFDARLDWRCFVAEADLPPAIAGTVSGVVRRTRLWRDEKVNVARELIAHFQDGLDAGHSANQLVKSFGEPTAAAQLIRRAKQRGRPLTWHLWRYGLWLFGALAGAYLVVALYLLMGRASITINYLTIINARAASVSESERAWPGYRNALGEMLVNRQFPEWSDNPGRSLGDSKWTEAVAWLNKHETALQMVRDAAGHKDLGFPVGVAKESFSAEDQGILFETGPVDSDAVGPAQEAWNETLIVSTHSPQLATLRTLAHLLMIDTRRAAAVGDGKAALANVRALLGISGHCQETPFLINTMVALEIENMAYVAIQDSLRDDPQFWSDAQLVELAHSVAASEVDWRRGIEGERASFYDILQRAYTDDGNGDGRPVFSGFGLFRILHDVSSRPNQATADWVDNCALIAIAAPTANFFVASRKEMANLYDEFLERSIQRIDTPLWETKNDPEAELNALFRDEPLGKLRYCMIALLAPSLENVRLSIATRNSLRDGVLVGIALVLFQREHGAFPKSLEELSPHWLPQVPVDPITGIPLGYKIVGGRPVVFSVGVDRDDDGGRLPLGVGNQPTSALASPMHFVANVDGAVVYDGDWVIWSTVPTSDSPSTTKQQ